MKQGVQALVPTMGICASCAALGVPRASYYRAITPPKAAGEPSPRLPPERALSDGERQQILALLNGERFMDRSPAEVFNTLLDEGVYLGSVRTFYRILAGNDEVRERRAQRRHPEYAKPELIATGPNQVWTWDITKLRGPKKWVYYYLYVILDIFSRYVVGWMLADREAGCLAQQLIEESCVKQSIEPGQLTIHSDRGPAMKSGPVVALHAKLGITKSSSRPNVRSESTRLNSSHSSVSRMPSSA